jgi:hypothetical protein
VARPHDRHTTALVPEAAPTLAEWIAGERDLLRRNRHPLRAGTWRLPRRTASGGSSRSGDEKAGLGSHWHASGTQAGCPIVLRADDRRHPTSRR